MKPVAFDYECPSSVDAAITLLAQSGNAKLLAGAQTLGPMLNLRLAQPDLVIDVTRIPELTHVETSTDSVTLGACITHAAIEDRRVQDFTRGLLPMVAHGIAYRAVRNRGTLGGSIALADPAAEYPACLVALDATIVVRSKGGERLVKAEDFFKGLFEVDLRPGELVVAAELTALLKDERSVFLELARRQGDYAIVGLAGISRSSERKIAFFGIAGKPILIKPKTLDEAKAALPAPAADLYHSAATKLHLAKVLLERAWNSL